MREEMALRARQVRRWRHVSLWCLVSATGVAGVCLAALLAQADTLAGWCGVAALILYVDTWLALFAGQTATARLWQAAQTLAVERDEREEDSTEEMEALDGDDGFDDLDDGWRDAWSLHRGRIGDTPGRGVPPVARPARALRARPGE